VEGGAEPAESILELLSDASEPGHWRSAPVRPARGVGASLLVAAGVVAVLIALAWVLPAPQPTSIWARSSMGTDGSAPERPAPALVERMVAPPSATTPARVVEVLAEAAEPPPAAAPRSYGATESAASAPALHAAAPRVPTAAGAVRRVPPRGPVPTRSNDAEVDLVAALIAHEALRVPASTHAGGTDPSLSIAELVGSCRQGDRQQRLACKARICRGYWGRAQACPAREQGRAERAAARQAPELALRS
jgi:hypothetical protein